MKKYIRGLIATALVSIGAHADIVVVVNNPPEINGQGRIEGSIQQLSAQDALLNGGAVIDGDWLVPGTPQINVGNGTQLLGIQDGDGDASPSNYTIDLQDNCSAGHIVRRTDPAGMPVVHDMISPQGTRSVSLKKATDSPGDFATLRDLSVSGQAGVIEVPTGAYGSFDAGGGGGFILGQAGSEETSIYYFEELTLNTDGELQVVSPVIIVIGSNFRVKGHCVMGNQVHPEWLQIELTAGVADLGDPLEDPTSLGNHSMVYGAFVAPFSYMIVNAHTELMGRIWCHGLRVNANGVLRYAEAGIFPPDNHSPVAEAQTLNAQEDVNLSITLTGTDADGDTLSFIVITQPTNGVLSGTAPDLVYEPSANVNGEDGFSFVVSDGSATSATAVVFISVDPVNDTPVAMGQSTTTPEDTSVAIILEGFDVDSDSLAFNLAAQPANGTLSGTAPNLIYTPAANFNGQDSFAFSVSDASSTSAVAQVSIQIDPVNDTPVASSQALSMLEDQDLAVLLEGNDVDEDNLAFAIAQPPPNGTLSGTVPNLIYTPTADFNGTDEFFFSVTDGTATSSVATVSITIDAVNDVPVASDQFLITPEDVDLAVFLAGNDVDGDNLAYTVVAVPTNGTLSGTVPNLNYESAADYNGTGHMNNDHLQFAINWKWKSLTKGVVIHEESLSVH